MEEKNKIIKNPKKYFIRKMFTTYSGWLYFALGCWVLGISCVILAYKYTPFTTFIIIASTIFLIAIFGFYMTTLITNSFKEKYIFFMRSIKLLEKNPNTYPQQFSSNYQIKCYRPIIKDLMLKYGFKEDYEEMRSLV